MRKTEDNQETLEYQGRAAIIAFDKLDGHRVGLSGLFAPGEDAILNRQQAERLVRWLRVVCALP